MTAEFLVLLIVVVTALGFDFTNGFHDTANAMAASIATGALKPKVAVTLSAILNLLGAFLSVEVAATVAKGIVDLGGTVGPGDGDPPQHRLGHGAVERTVEHDDVAEEPRDGLRRGARVDPRGRTDLLQGAAAEHRDLVGEGESLGLVVGDEHGGDARGAEDVGDGGAGRDPQARVEGREGLIEQHDPRAPRERPCERDALLLAAGQLVRIAPRERGIQRDSLQEFLDPAGGGTPAHGQRCPHPEGDVARDGEVREQRAVLGHDPDADDAEGERHGRLLSWKNDEVGAGLRGLVTATRHRAGGCGPA